MGYSLMPLPSWKEDILCCVRLKKESHQNHTWRMLTQKLKIKGSFPCSTILECDLSTKATQAQHGQIFRLKTEAMAASQDFLII